MIVPRAEQACRNQSAGVSEFQARASVGGALRDRVRTELRAGSPAGESRVETSLARLPGIISRRDRAS